MKTSHTQIRSFAFALVVAALTTVGCKARQETPSVALQSEKTPSKQLSAQDAAAWPELVSGGAAPLFRTAGIVVGITPDKSRAFNAAAGDSLKARAAAKLLSQLQARGPSFFVIAAVNPKKLSAFARPMVSRSLRSELAGEMETYYGAAFAPWRNTGILEASMLAVNDSELATHESLGLAVPQAPGEGAPLSAVVVSKSGQVYGPFALTGSVATGAQELDAVFTALNGVLAD